MSVEFPCCTRPRLFGGPNVLCCLNLRAFSIAYSVVQLRFSWVPFNIYRSVSEGIDLSDDSEDSQATAMRFLCSANPPIFGQLTAWNPVGQSR